MNIIGILSFINRKLCLPLHRNRTEACTNGVFDLRKDGRVVDYTGLENRRTETCRGFESLSFRQNDLKGIHLVPFFCTRLPIFDLMLHVSLHKGKTKMGFGA